MFKQYLGTTCPMTNPIQFIVCFWLLYSTNTAYADAGAKREVKLRNSQTSNDFFAVLVSITPSSLSRLIRFLPFFITFANKYELRYDIVFVIVIILQLALYVINDFLKKEKPS